MADAQVDPYTLTPVDQDPFTPLPPVSLTSVDHDPFQDAITYANNLPPVGSPQDQSTHWAAQSGMPYGGREMAADPTVPMAARIISAVPIALGDQVSNLASTSWNAATLPGDVVLGKTDPMSPDAIARSTNLAGLMQSGGEGGVNTTASGWSPAAKSYLDKAIDEALSPGKVDVEQAMSAMALGGGPESAAKAMQGVDEDNIGHTLLKQAQNLHDTENDGVKAATQFGWNQPSANYLGNELAKATDQEDHASVNKLGKLINSGPQSVSGMSPNTGPYSLDPVMDQHINNLVGLKDPSTKGPLTTLATNRGWNSDAVGYMNDVMNDPETTLKEKMAMTNMADWGSDQMNKNFHNPDHPYYFAEPEIMQHHTALNEFQKPTPNTISSDAPPPHVSPAIDSNGWNPKAMGYLQDEWLNQHIFDNVDPMKVDKLQSLIDAGPQGLATMLSSNHPYATDPFVLGHAEKAVNLHNAETTSTKPYWHPSVVDKYDDLSDDHADAGNLKYAQQIQDSLDAGPNAPKLPDNLFQNQMDKMHNTQMGVFPSSKPTIGPYSASLPKAPYTPPPPLTPKADRFVGPTLPHNPNNLDLSEEARNARAREQGYNPDQVFYHGVNDPLEQSSRFQARNQSFADPRTKGEKGLFLATNPYIADQYTGVPQAQPRGQVLPLLSSAKNIKTIDWRDATDTGDYSGKHMRDQINKAIDAGYDALHIKNMYDVGGKQEQFVAFNPNQIRSKFAVFDPKYAQSSNLLSARGLPLAEGDDYQRSKLTPVDHDPFK